MSLSAPNRFISAQGSFRPNTNPAAYQNLFSPNSAPRKPSMRRLTFAAARSVVSRPTNLSPAHSPWPRSHELTPVLSIQFPNPNQPIYCPQTRAFQIPFERIFGPVALLHFAHSKPLGTPTFRVPNPNNLPADFLVFRLRRRLYRR